MVDTLVLETKENKGSSPFKGNPFCAFFDNKEITFFV
jgi:hypothetical protein